MREIEMSLTGTQRIHLDTAAGAILIRLVAVSGQRVRIGITAPDGVSVHREETLVAIEPGLRHLRRFDEGEVD